MAEDLFWIEAEWPVPRWIRAGTTTRNSGYSVAPYSGLNLAQHVGDKFESVERNRRLVGDRLQLPATPLWLRQVHGDRVIKSENWSEDIAADGCYTSHQDEVCAILSADCLPLLLCNREGTEIAAVHLGWRGLGAGTIEAALGHFKTGPEDILAWLGPHIHSENYEVGAEVRDACLKACPGTDHAFNLLTQGKWLANLAALARHRLQAQGITGIFACNMCTFDKQEIFYSYRKQRVTGRMASLIWMAAEE